MKRILAFFLAVLFVFSVCPMVFAEDVGIEYVMINPYGGEESDIDTISWFRSGERCFMFLPADITLADAKVWIGATAEVQIDGAKIASGDDATAFTVGEHTLSCGDKNVSLTVMRSANIPAIFIETESGSLDYILQDKENKEAATIRVYEKGVKTLDDSLKSIKGRGNSTWQLAKKPFNIKFDKKTSMLGMPKAKKWSLLANYLDDTAVKTLAGFALGGKNFLDIPYTSEGRNVDLYLNGEYYGNFTVCESVEVGEDRVDITDLAKLNEKANPDVEDIEALPVGGTGENGTVENRKVKGSMKWVNIPNDPEDITGGYLLEMDFANRYEEEVSGFISPLGQWVVVKAPEFASEAEVRYIAGLYAEAEEALFSETGYNSLGKHFSEYFDVETMIKTYLFLELSKSYDAALSSFYLFKDSDSDKLFAAPVWDFDLSFCADVKDRSGGSLKSPEGWFANSLSYGKSGSAPFNTETVLTAFFRHEEIRPLVADAWNGSILRTAPEQFNALVAFISAQSAASRKMNLVRWKYHTATDPIASATSRAASAFDKVRGFINTRIMIMDAAFKGDIAMLYYDANGSTGHVYNREIAFLEDSVTVLDVTSGDAFITVPAGNAFAGWNTKADGTGETYQPGEQITLTDKTTVLYAVWTPAEPGSEPTEDPTDVTDPYDPTDPYGSFEPSDPTDLYDPEDPTAPFDPSGLDPVEFMPGDVDDDGKISAADARLALRAAVKLVVFEPDSQAFLAADANKDNAITSDDARKILRASVHLEDL